MITFQITILVYGISELPLIGITNYQNYQLSELPPIKAVPLTLNLTLILTLNPKPRSNIGNSDQW